jgi:hypothetical protein
MLPIFTIMSERKFGADTYEEEEEGTGEAYGQEAVSDISEDFTEHASAFPDFDRRLIQEIISSAEGGFKFKPEEWSDLLMRLQVVIDDFKTGNPETDDDDLRAELQGLLSEARDLTVH